MFLSCRRPMLRLYSAMSLPSSSFGFRWHTTDVSLFDRVIVECASATLYSGSFPQSSSPLSWPTSANALNRGLNFAVLLSNVHLVRDPSPLGHRSWREHQFLFLIRVRPEKLISCCWCQRSQCGKGRSWTSRSQLRVNY